MGIITTKNPGVFDCILPQLCYTDWLSLCRCVHVHGWVCLCCPCTFQCPLRLCWNVCTRGHFFCFCTESFHCAVSFGWTAPSHLVLSTASIISSLNVVSYGGGGGEGGETFLAIVIAKCFLTFRRGSLGILGGEAKSFLDSVLHDRRSTKVVTPGTSTK